MILADNEEIIGKITPPVKRWGGDVGEILSKIGSFGLRLFLIIVGIVAFIYLLRGGLDWIISGGDKEKITAARNTITHAIVGLILIFVVVAGIYMIEKLLFGGQLCLGLFCAIKFPVSAP